MAALGQLRNEAAADRAARAYHENSHDVPVPSMRRPAVTPGGAAVSLLLTRRLGGESDRHVRAEGTQADGETDDWLAERFEEHRGRLRAVAYRMLGSLDEADDAVQEAWVRFSAAGAGQVENLGGWLTTIVTRVCLNALRARAARPETLAGPHVPDPVLSPADGPTPGAGGAAGRLGRAGAAGGAGHADPGRAGRVRAARRVRRPVRRDRPDARAARRKPPGSWPAGRGTGSGRRARRDPTAPSPRSGR